MATTFFLHLFFLQVGFTAVATITYSCSSNAKCGCSYNSAVLTKIVGGEPAGTDTWSWTVSIRVRNSHICGGSLISSTLILTAAHCVTSIKSLSSLSINVGSKYLSVIRQQRSVLHVYVPQNYNSRTFENDIAIIRVSSPIDLKDRSISLICLPSKIFGEYPPAGASVVAVGWGLLSPDIRLTSNILQQVTLQIISQTSFTCQSSVYNDNIQFCSGFEQGGKDTCQGDSGGPLMMFSNSQWILVGITSFGTGCALPEHPGIYTRVSYYVDWIDCFLKNNSTCIEKSIFKQYLCSSIGSTIFYENISIIFLCCLLLNLDLL